ncbi:MAG: glycosyltransferase [Acidimicrobiales bacterium]|jgi:glycosyltransferase involved in cell wall biosynthesis
MRGVLSSRPSLVVLCAANDWDGPWFADQQFAVALSKHVPVLYVDPAVSFRSGVPKGFLARPWVRELGPGLTRLSPVGLPGGQRPGAALVTSALVAHRVRQTVRAMGTRVDVLVDCFPRTPVLGRCGERRKVYWAQDDFGAMAELVGVSRSQMEAGERHLARRADLVMAANPRVAERWSKSGARTELIPFGCDPAAFAAVPELVRAPDVRLEGPIAGFVGHIGERIDPAMMRAVADAGVSLLLVGPKHPRFDIGSLEGFFDRANVQWVGARRFEELPPYLAAMDVGLVPYNHSAFNEASFPLKTLEYLAAGVRVVATDLPAIGWLDCPFVEVADTPSSYGEAVLQALQAPNDRATRASLQAFASRHSWDARAEQFLAVLETV